MQHDMTGMSGIGMPNMGHAGGGFNSMEDIFAQFGDVFGGGSIFDQFFGGGGINGLASVTFSEVTSNCPRW